MAACLEVDWISQVSWLIKNTPVNIGDTRDMGPIPGLGMEDMATHSNILAWRIPWTEEPGGLQSMGLQRIGHDWANKDGTRHSVYVNPKVLILSFPGSSVVKNLLVSAGDMSSIPGLGRPPEEGNGNPLQLFLPGKSHEQWSQGGCSPRDHKQSNTTQNTCKHLSSSCCWDRHWVPLDNPEVSLSVFKAGL